MYTKIIFLKLGGSLITDKTKASTDRPAVLHRLAHEIRSVLDQDSTIQLILGHGSGSFGHVSAAKYNTRQGVSTRLQWMGFSEVSMAAAHLNGLVVAAMHKAGVPVISIRPSAIVECKSGKIIAINPYAIDKALAANVVPLIMGDVAFDDVQGGTIVSTEEVMTAIAQQHIKPDQFILAGETEGVYDSDGLLIPKLTPDNLAHYHTALGGSRGTDVTGGMVSKVNSMLALSQSLNGLPIQIISGLKAGNLSATLTADAPPIGTLLTSS